MPATRTLQLPRRPSVDALLDHIDGHAAPAQVAEREEPWWPYRAYPLDLTATGPAGSSRELSVVARNLSRGGMSFLSKRFLTPATRCTMRLRTLEQDRRTVVGAVRRCEPVGGGVHEVGVQFLQPIDTTQFVRIQVAARILIAEDNSVIRRLTSFILEWASAVPVMVETGPAAVAAASESFFNLILMAIDLPGHCKSGGDAPATVEQGADFIGALLDAAGVQRAALVGHSWGSLIAMEAAARLKDRISHLVLVGTAFPMKVSPALIEASQTGCRRRRRDQGKIALCDDSHAASGSSPKVRPIRRAG